MKKILYATVGFGFLVSPFNIMAQRDSRHFEKDAVEVVNESDADVNHVQKTLKENAPQSPKDNGLPRFALVGKDKKFYLGIGGQFLGEGVFDFGDEMASPLLFTPSAMTAKTPGNGANLGFAWQSSSVYLNFVAMPGSGNQLGLFFKGNFTGDDSDFGCYHFYARYRGLTAGYTNSLFTDGAAEPMTIDFEGPNGYPFINLFTAYWTQSFTMNLSGAIGIDAPTASYTAGHATEMVNQRVPAIPLYLQYAWDGGNSHLRLSGLVRPMQYRNTVDEKNITMTGLGMQLSGMAQIVGGLSINYNVAYGRGIGTYLQDDNGLGLDAVPSTEVGHLDMVKTMGVTGGLSYNFSSRLSTNLVYSHLTNWLADSSLPQDTQYRYGDYVAANIIYNINKFVSAGIEYDYGHRKNFDSDSLHTNRLQLQFAVTF